MAHRTAPRRGEWQAGSRRSRCAGSPRGYCAPKLDAAGPMVPFSRASGAGTLRPAACPMPAPLELTQVKPPGRQNRYRAAQDEDISPPPLAYPPHASGDGGAAVVAIGPGRSPGLHLGEYGDGQRPGSVDRARRFRAGPLPSIAVPRDVSRLRYPLQPKRPEPGRASRAGRSCLGRLVCRSGRERATTAS